MPALFASTRNLYVFLQAQAYDHHEITRLSFCVFFNAHVYLCPDRHAVFV